MLKHKPKKHPDPQSTADAVQAMASLRAFSRTSIICALVLAGSGSASARTDECRDAIDS